MKPNVAGFGRTYHAPEPEYSLLGTVLATGVLLGAVFLALLAASAPWTAAATVVTAVVVYSAGRTLLRRRRGRTRTVCLPRTDVCVGV